MMLLDFSMLVSVCGDKLQPSGGGVVGPIECQGDKYGEACAQRGFVGYIIESIRHTVSQRLHDHVIDSEDLPSVLE